MDKDRIWTVGGDQTSWDSWAEAMESAVATPFMKELIDMYGAVVTCFCSKEWLADRVTETGLVIETIELKTNQSEAGEQRNWFITCRK